MGDNGMDNTHTTRQTSSTSRLWLTTGSDVSIRVMTQSPFGDD